MPMKRLIVVRHGETDYNKKFILQGWSDLSRLNSIGLEQAGALGARLSTERVDSVHCSSLSRALQTAEAVINARTGNKLPIRTYDELREISFGQEGDSFHPETEEGQKFRVLYHKVKAFRYVLITFKWENGDLEAHADGGESPQQVIDRAAPIFKEIANSGTPDEVPLIVAHGRMLRIVLSHLLQTPISQVQQGNTALNVLLWDGSKFTAVLLNSCSHCASAPVINPYVKKGV